MRSHVRATSAMATLVLGAAATASASDAASPEVDVASVTSLKSLSIQELMNLDVTSVTKSAGPLSDAAAAVYVITRDDILRSGARSIVEMLRLAPNLQVAQITSTSFAITARGFNGSAASKLLVLVDGRSVYTPYHSGVSWDVQDVLPEDIERIEVISGPGATLWGANAVNGVINITTRASGDTHGGSLALGGGNLEQRASVQYGDGPTGDLSYRAYVKSFHYGDDVTATGMNAKDGWYKSQGGFRLDWTPANDRVTLQGDLYQGSERKLIPPDESISGGNILARWTHDFAADSTLQVQTYYDYVAFSLPNVASDYLNTYDLDVQHSFSWGRAQSIVWGGGVRIQNDNFPTVLSNTQPLLFSPQQRTLNLVNLFIQDSLSVSPSVKLILGTKLEDDPYSGVEPLPSARLSWKLTDSNLLWLAVSRAVRAPSRIDRDLFEVLGPVVLIRGGDFKAEKLIAYEAGYRSQPTANTALSVSTFYNVYTDLRSVEPSPGGQFPLMFANLMAGHTYGAEAWGNYRVSSAWQLTFGANWLHKSLHFRPDSAQLGGVALAGNDPNYQLSVGSTVDLARDWVLNVHVRRIGALPNPSSPAYTEADARIGWTVSRTVQLSLTGSNLLHAHHLEFGTGFTPIQLGSTGVESGRSIFVEMRAQL